MINPCTEKMELKEIFLNCLVDFPSRYKESNHCCLCVCIKKGMNCGCVFKKQEFIILYKEL